MTGSKCPCCGNCGNVEIRRRLTAYEDDRKNHLLSCYKCFKRDCDAMEEMWSEYNKWEEKLKQQITSL